MPGEDRVGNRRFPSQSRATIGKIRFLLGKGIKLFVHRRVHATDKEGRDRLDCADVYSFARRLLHAFFVGMHNCAVSVNGEDQRGIHADSLSGDLSDRGKTFTRRRDLDHHIGTIHFSMQRNCLLDGGCRVVSESRIHFDGNAAILPLCLGIDVGKDIAGSANVRGGECANHIVDGCAGFGHCGEILCILGTSARNRLLEDRRVRGDAANTLGVDQCAKVA